MKNGRVRLIWVVALILGLMLMLTIGTSVLAQTTATQDSSQGRFNSVITIAPGGQSEIQVEGLKRFLVGATNIVGAEQSGSKLVLTAKQTGTTAVAVWTESGMNVYQVKVLTRPDEAPAQAAAISAAAPANAAPAAQPAVMTKPAPAATPVAAAPAVVAQAPAVVVAPAPKPVEPKQVFPLVNVNLQPGESQVLKGEGITRTSVGDPLIADIVPVSKAEILVNAKKEGTTTVRIWDSRGLSTYNIIVAKKVPTPEEIASEITNQIAIPSISARIVGDTIVLSGVAPSAEISARAASIAEATGRKVINMVTVESISAEKVVGSLKAALPDVALTYDILPDQTVLMKGQVPSEDDAQRIKDVLQTWIGTPEQVASEKTGGTSSINFNGQQQEVPPDVTVKSRTAAYETDRGVVDVKEELNFSHRVFGGRITNGPRVVAMIDINPSLAKQVLVSAMVLEVDRSKLKELGIQWGEILGENAINPLIVFEDRATASFGTFGPVRRTTLEANVQALVDENAAKVLSQPKVLITDGHAAHILVGGELPIPVAQSLNGLTNSITVEFKPFGIQLSVKPQITPDSRILLTLTPEVSQIDADTTKAIRTGTIQIPALKTSRATSVVHMGNGESLAIGGLYSSNDVKAMQRVPLLSRIPVIGELFKSRRFQRSETELIIVVTPQIIERGAAVPIPMPADPKEPK